MELNCNELVLDNLVRVDLIEHSALGITIPPNVPMLQQVTLGTVQPLVALSVGFAKPSEADSLRIDHFSELDESSAKVTLKSTKAISALGWLYSFDFQITGVMDATTSIKQAVEAEWDLQCADFSLLLHHADGSKRLCYFLSNTSTFSVEQNSSADSVQVTLKVAGKSCSNWIEVIS